MIQQVKPHNRWPTGDSMHLAILKRSPAELSEQFELVFEVYYDDLDQFWMAAIALPNGQQAWLERHAGDPDSETIVLIDRGADPHESLGQIMELFEFSIEDIRWVSPSVEDADEVRVRTS